MLPIKCAAYFTILTLEKRHIPLKSAEAEFTKMTEVASKPFAGKPIAPFALSLFAGLLILVSGGILMGFSRASYYGGMMGGYFGMMNGYYSMMGGYGGGFFYAFSAMGIVSGILVIVGAIMLYNEPGRAYAWGSVILAFSVLSFFGMGGFLLGALLGIVGGILALTWREP